MLKRTSLRLTPAEAAATNTKHRITTYRVNPYNHLKINQKILAGLEIILVKILTDFIFGAERCTINAKWIRWLCSREWVESFENSTFYMVHSRLATQLDFPAPISSQCSRSPFNAAIKIENKSSGGRGTLLSSHPSRGSVTSAVSGWFVTFT